MYGEFSVWKGPLTKTHGHRGLSQTSIHSCQVLARGKVVPEVRRAAFKDALYRDEKLKGDGELILGKRI